MKKFVKKIFYILLLIILFLVFVSYSQVKERESLQNERTPIVVDEELRNSPEHIETILKDTSDERILNTLNYKNHKPERYSGDQMLYDTEKIEKDFKYFNNATHLIDGFDT